MMHLHMSLLALQDVVPRISWDVGIYLVNVAKHSMASLCSVLTVLLVKKLVSFSALTLFCWFGHLACKNRPRNDL